MSNEKLLISVYTMCCFEGTIADREHRKWQTAVPLENNPYSEENLQKRLLERKYKPKYSDSVG